VLWGFGAQANWSFVTRQLIGQMAAGAEVLGLNPAARLPLAPRQSLTERLYRRLDERVLGRRWPRQAAYRVREWQGGALPVAAVSAPVLAWDAAAAQEAWALGSQRVLWFTANGRALDGLAEAVRDRLGQPQGRLSLDVWALDSSGHAVLMLAAQCALEHRSLSRSVQLVVAKVRELWGAFQGKAGASEWAAADSAPASTAVGSERLAAVALLLRLVQSVVARLFVREQWFLRIRRPSQDGHAPGWQTLLPPRTSFWADPFLLAEPGGGVSVYFEDLPFATGRGQINVLTLDARGTPTGPDRVALQADCHLSYPFLWCDAGRVYMIPESSGRATVDLYERLDAPDRWVWRQTLIEGARLVDATVVRYEGSLWLFAAGAGPGASLNDSLYLYRANTITGPWVPHARNPVKLDAASSRPAGGMWVEHGVLHRVVQDCSNVYGGRVRCMRVSRLSLDAFEETEVTAWQLADSLASRRWHTYNTAGGWAVVDVLTRRLR
jgi:hypothetical protein